MKNKKIEVIAITLKDAIDIEKAGGDRIELVKDLSKGGLTPDISLVEEISKNISIPMRVMVRDISDSFIYNEEIMRSQIDYIQKLRKFNLDGIVFGSLTNEGKINEKQLNEVVKSLGNMKLTFHRAFDEINSDYLIKTLKILEKYKNVDTILTSGQEKSALDGIELITKLRKLTKLNILPGVGIDENNCKKIVEISKANFIHIGNGVRDKTNNISKKKILKIKELINMKNNLIVGDKNELENLVVDEMVKILAESENPHFILATGSSPKEVYKKLVKKSQNEKIDFSKLVTYNLDEYREIDKFPQYSFKKFMNDNLFNHINIKQENINFPNEIEEYNLKLDKIKKFDFTILGVGKNGHIAFNEPGTPFNSRTIEVKLTQSTIESNFLNEVDHPTHAITMGLNDIYNKSSKIFLLAWGEDKREALTKFLEGKKTLNWPITNLIDHLNITIVTNINDLLNK